MRFNQFGDLAAGRGGNILSVNKKFLGLGFDPKWRDNNTYIANAVTGGNWVLAEGIVSDNWIPKLLDSRGMTTLAAAGPNWAATIATNPYQTYGKLDNLELPYPYTTYHALDGWYDGSMIFTPEDYQQLIVRWGDGAVSSYPVGIHWLVDSVRMIEGGFVYYEEPSNFWLVLRGQNPRIIPTVDVPRSPNSFVDRNGKRWIFYYNEYTYLHPEDSFYGYRFDQSYRPDIDYSSNHLFFVATTWNAAEAPEAITITGPLRLGDDVGEFSYIGPAPKTVQGIINLKSQETIITPFNHNVTVAIFKDPDGTSGSPAEIVVNRKDQAIDRPYFVAEDSVRGKFKGALLGIYAEGTVLPHALELAKERNTRVAYCIDGPEVPYVPEGLRPFDQIWIEFYLVVRESLEESVQRWDENLYWLSSIWKGDIGIVPMFYTQGVWTVEEVIEGLRHLSRLVNSCLQVKVVAPFSYQRANGIIVYPELQEVWKQLKRATPGQATFIPIPPTQLDNKLVWLRRIKMSDIKAPMFINSRMLNSVGNNEFTVTMPNPLPFSFYWLPEKGTVLPGVPNPTPDGVLSIQPIGGDFELRPKGTAGGYEKCKKVNGFLRFEPTFGQVFMIPYTE